MFEYEGESKLPSLKKARWNALLVVGTAVIWWGLVIVGDSENRLPNLAVATLYTLLCWRYVRDWISLRRAWAKCPMCDGKGYRTVWLPPTGGRFSFGKSRNDSCAYCHGDGKRKEW